MKSIQVKWLLTAIILILISISAILYYRLERLNDSVTKLYIANSSNDLKQINNLIFESHFKDDLVLSSFNTSTTIIITFFTVIIALGGYISFKKIDEDIRKLKESATLIEKTAIEVTEAKSNIQNTLSNITTLKIELYHVIMMQKFEQYDLNMAKIAELLYLPHTNGKGHMEIILIHFNRYIQSFIATINTTEKFIETKKINQETNTTNFITIDIEITTNGFYNTLKIINEFLTENENILTTINTSAYLPIFDVLYTNTTHTGILKKAMNIKKILLKYKKDVL